MLAQKLLLPAAFALLLLLIVSIGPIVGPLLFTVVIVGAMLIKHPRPLLALFFSYTAIQCLVTASIRNILVGYLDEMMVVAATVMVLAPRAMGRSGGPTLRVLSRLVTLYLMVVGASAWVNAMDTGKAGVPLLHFVLTYLRFVPIFYLAYDCARPGDARSFMKAGTVFLLLQVALNAGWYMGINPLPNNYVFVDLSQGSMGASNYTAYFLIPVILCLLASFITPDVRVRRAGIVLLLLLSTIQFYMCFAVHAYLLLAVSLAIWMLQSGKLAKHLVRIGVASLLLWGTVLALNVFFQASGYTFLDELSPTRLLERFAAMKYSPKGIVYRGVLFEAPHEMPVPLLGAGPGKFGSIVGFQYNTPLAERYINYIYDTWSGREMMLSGSITQNPHCGALGIWSETGPIGFALFFGMHVYAALRISRQYRRGAYRDSVRRILASAILPSMASWLLLSLVWDAFHMSILQCGLWAAMAVVWDPDPPEQEIQPVGGNRLAVISAKALEKGHV